LLCSALLCFSTDRTFHLIIRAQLQDSAGTIELDAESLMSALSEVQQIFYHGLQQEIIARHLGSDNI
jgi:hypothetical protein